MYITAHRTFAFALSFASLAACTNVTPIDATPAPDAAAPPSETTTPAPPLPPPPSADGGGSLDGGADAEVDGAAPTYCELRTSKCGRSAAKCAEERACFASMRPGVGTSIEQCFVASQKCNGIDTCLEIEAAKLAAEPSAKAFTDACLAKYATCGQPRTFSDDDCVNLRVFGGATLAALQACVAAPCADVGRCFEVELGKAGCN